MVDKIFFSLALIMLTEVLGWSLILPFIPYYAEQFGATPLVIGFIIASFSIFQFISAPIIGKLSDHYGRKNLLIISQLATFAGFTILGFANSLFMIFLSRIIDGLFGSNATLTRAYATDITKGRNRAKIFAYFGAIFGLGMFIGPAIGGLLSTISYSVPAFVAAGISLISLILIITLLKETVTAKKRVSIKLNDFFPLKLFINGLRIKRLRSVFIEFFFFIMSFTLLTSSMSLYVKYQLGFGPVDVGILLMIVGLSSSLFQVLALPRLIDKHSEKRLNLSGLIITTAAMFGIMIVNSMFGIYIITILFSVGGGLTRPMLITKLSERSKKVERGKNIGILDSLGSVAQMIGPILGGLVIELLYPWVIGLVAGLFVMTALIYELRNGSTKLNKTL